MRPAAKRTLQILADSELWLSPNNIAENAGYASGTIRNELSGLLADGYVDKKDKPGDPFYRITAEGRACLEGEDKSELESEDGSNNAKN